MGRASWGADAGRHDIDQKGKDPNSFTITSISPHPPFTPSKGNKAARIDTWANRPPKLPFSDRKGEQTREVLRRKQ